MKEQTLTLSLTHIHDTECSTMFLRCAMHTGCQFDRDWYECLQSNQQMEIAFSDENQSKRYVWPMEITPFSFQAQENHEKISFGRFRCFHETHVRPIDIHILYLSTFCANGVMPQPSQPFPIKLAGSLCWRHDVQCIMYMRASTHRPLTMTTFRWQLFY